MEKFVDLVNEFASDLIASNHMADTDLSTISVRDLITPGVITQKEAPSKVA